MFMKNILIFFLSLATMVLVHLPAFEAKAIDKDWTFDPKTSTLIPKYLGKVKVLNGKAVIGDRELKKGSKIYNDELVQTFDKSFVVLELIDLTVITLGPNSDFKVDKWDYRTKNDRSAVFTVVKGQWRALIKSKSKDDDQLKIKTNLISMGVRGTELLVTVAKENEQELNQIALLEGNIHFEGELPDGLKKDLVAGDYALIKKDATGSSKKEKILNSDEMKSYQEFTAPEVLRLLDHVATNSHSSALPSSETQNGLENSNASSAHAIKESGVKKAKDSPHSLQENLNILNKTREKNRKSK